MRKLLISIFIATSCLVNASIFGRQNNPLLIIIVLGKTESAKMLAARNKVAAKYGFVYQVGSGCIVSEHIADSASVHNEYVRKRLTARNGNNWE